MPGIYFEFLWLNAALAGWRLGVLQTLQSGPAFTVVTAANATNAFLAGPNRADLVGDPNLPSDERTLSRWCNTAAFANPAPHTFGNSPRSVLRGPGLATTDLTVEKNIAPLISVPCRARDHRRTLQLSVRFSF